jgi:hypothetical protein
VTEEDLTADIEKNPIPHTMVISGSQYPFVMNGDDQILQLISEHPLESLDSNSLKTDFTVEYSQGIYRLTIESWAEPPHFSAAYYVEEEHRLLLTSMTDRGFRALVDRFTKHGFGFWIEPDIRVNLSMLTCIKDILGRELQLNPYEEYFTVKSNPSEQDTLNKLNRLLSLAEETARELLSHSTKRIKTLQNKVDKKERNKRKEPKIKSS